MKRQTKLLIFLGIPLGILIVMGIATTAFLSISMVTQGVKYQSPSTLILGIVVASLWIMMFWKTAHSHIGALTSSPKK